MKKHLQRLLFGLLACVALGLVTEPAVGESLRLAGVLGNSGEAGETLVRLDPRGADRYGIGVAADRFNRLWATGGPDWINGYSLDGRALLRVELPGRSKHDDRLALVGDCLIVQRDHNLLAIDVTASQPTAQPLVEGVQRIARDGVKGELPIVRDDGRVEWIDVATGSTRPLLDASVRFNRYDDLLLIDRDTLVILADGGAHWFVDGQAADGRRVEKLHGAHPRRVGDAVYSFAWHGTALRHDLNLRPDPGVVLGGASGSFIGFLPGNRELHQAAGAAAIRGEQEFAIAAIGGELYLARYDHAQRKLALTRRIGSEPTAAGIVVNTDGAVYVNGGAWAWDALPGAPKSSGAAAGQLVSELCRIGPNHAVGLSYRHGEAVITGGPIVDDGLSMLGVDSIPDDVEAFLRSEPAAAAVVDELTLLVLYRDGAGRALRVSSRGEFGKDLGPISIQADPAVQAWTSLTTLPDGRLLAAGDGQLFTLERTGDGPNDWRAVDRFKRWGEGEGEHFGENLRVHAEGGRVWVSDTGRHRVLVFDALGAAPVAQFGQTDAPGAGLGELDRPGVLSVFGPRAAIHDAVNQRIVRLVIE